MFRTKVRSHLVLLSTHGQHLITYGVLVEIERVKLINIYSVMINPIKLFMLSTAQKSASSNLLDAHRT